MNTPPSLSPQKRPSKTTRNSRRLIKGHCEQCSYYKNCPRMQGKNVCYGKKEQLIELPTTVSQKP